MVLQIILAAIFLIADAFLLTPWGSQSTLYFINNRIYNKMLD